MKCIIQKIFDFGIYGAQTENFTDDELKTIIFNPSIEFLSESDHKKLQNNFTTESFYDTTVSILESLAISKKKKIKGLKEKLRGLYIKLNAIEWRERAIGSLFLFKRVDYFFILDKLVKNDFVKYSEINNESKITNKLLINFFSKMVSIGYLETKTEDGDVLYRINRKDGKIVIPTVKKKSPVFLNLDEDELCKKLKEFIKTNEKGVLTTEIAQELGISLKPSLRIAQKLCKENTKYLSFLEVVGKIKRFRFFYHENIKDRRNSNLEGPNNGVILRKDKIEILREFIDERKPFIVDGRMIKEFAELMKTKYVPDIKNFKKLVVESGYKIFSVYYFNNNIVKYIVCDKTADEKALTDRFKPKFVKKIENCDTKQEILHSYFVAYRRFIELDNGYIDDLNERTRSFVDYLDQMSCIEKDVIFDKEFVRNMKLKDVFKYLPYQFYLKRREELIDGKKSIYIFESNDFRAEGTDIEYDVSYNELVHLKYTNIDFLKLKTALIVFNFKSILSKLINDGYACEKIDGNFKINLKVKPEIKKVKHIPQYYISRDRRFEFYEKISLINSKNIVGAILSVINNFYHDEEKLALKQRLAQFKRNTKDLIVDNSPIDLPVRPQKDSDLYISLKEELMNNMKINLSAYENSKTRKFLEIVRLLRANKIIVSEKNPEILHFNQEYMSAFDILNIQTTFPLEYFWLDLPDEGNIYQKNHSRLIAYFLILEGTHTIGSLHQKIKILEMFELEYILAINDDKFIIETINDVKYVSIIILYKI